MKVEPSLSGFFLIPENELEKQVLDKWHRQSITSAPRNPCIPDELTKMEFLKFSVLREVAADMKVE